jgi:hypothetical protein
MQVWCEHARLVSQSEPKLHGPPFGERDLQNPHVVPLAVSTSQKPPRHCTSLPHAAPSASVPRGRHVPHHMPETKTSSHEYVE